MLKIVIAATVTILACSAQAQTLTRLPNPAFSGTEQYTRVLAINRTYVRALGDLRSEYLSIRAADGGELSSEHRSEMQARLDGIQANWRRRVRNANPFSVDGFGQPNANFAATQPLYPTQ